MYEDEETAHSEKSLDGRWRETSSRILQIRTKQSQDFGSGEGGIKSERD